MIMHLSAQTSTDEWGFSADKPLPPPGWALHSINEDGGITHETASPLRPTITRSAPHGWELVPTEVSLSVTDLHVDGRWIRTQPVVQVESGSYSPEGARQLHAALTAFLIMIDVEGPDDPDAGPVQQQF